MRDAAREMQPGALGAHDPFDGLASIGLAEHSGIGPAYELAPDTRESLARAYFDGAKHDLVATALATDTAAFRDFLSRALPGSPWLAGQIAEKATPALTGLGWGLRVRDAATAYETLQTQYALPAGERDSEKVIKAAQSLAVNTMVPIADIATRIGRALSMASPVGVLGTLALSEAVAFYYRDPENLGRLGAEMVNPTRASDLFDQQAGLRVAVCRAITPA